jgi:hypothetical protein
MDRGLAYQGALPRTIDLLSAYKFAQQGLGHLAQAALGTATGVSGLGLSPTSPASMTVNVAPGSIYSYQTQDTVAYGDLGTDATPIVKQGILYNATTLTFSAPSTSGYSQNFIIYATFTETDGNPILLNYFNSAAPLTPLAGAGGNGLAQNTVRYNQLNIAFAAGVAAPTGSQAWPSIPGGAIPLYVLTTTNGQTQITSANWYVHPAAPFITPLPLLPVAHAGADAVNTNAYAATVSPAITALADGMSFDLKATNVNTSATCTFNPSGLGAISIYRYDGSALQVGDIAASPYHARLVYDAVSNKLLLQNPALLAAPPAGVTSVWSQTAAGTYTFTAPKTGLYWCEVVGGGGGGAGTNGSSSSGGGGGSGGYSAKWIYLTAGQTVTAIVGGGGAGGSAANPSTAATGGTTSFGAYIQATGGVGGINNAAGTTSAGGAPGVGSGGQINIYGANGGDGNPLNAAVQGGAGASSIRGGGGRTAIGGGSVANGLAPGSGGGGCWSSTSHVGGNGADGEIRVSY